VIISPTAAFTTSEVIVMDPIPYVHVTFSNNQVKADMNCLIYKGVNCSQQQTALFSVFNCFNFDGQLVSSQFKSDQIEVNQSLS
jgi:hypothetical protein